MKINKKLISQSIMQASINETTTITTKQVATKIPLKVNTHIDNINGLEIYSGGIKCNFDGYVEVSAYAHIVGLTENDDIGLFVSKNEISTNSSAVANGLAGWQRSTKTDYHFGLSDSIVQVSNGDILYLIMYNATGARGTISDTDVITRLNVKYIDFN